MGNVHSCLAGMIQCWIFIGCNSFGVFVCFCFAFWEKDQSAYSWPHLTVEATFCLNPHCPEVLKKLPPLITTCSSLFCELLGLVGDLVCVEGESKTQGRSSGVPASTHLYWLCDHCNLHPCCLCWLVERFYFPFIRANLHKSRHWDHGAFAASSWGCLTILVQLSLVVLLGSRSQAIPACAVPGLTAFLLILQNLPAVQSHCVLLQLHFTASSIPSSSWLLPDCPATGIVTLHAACVG